MTPEQITGQLTKQGASLAPSANGVYVVLVRHVDVEWTKIGILTRTTGPATSAVIATSPNAEALQSAELAFGKPR